MGLGARTASVEIFVFPIPVRNKLSPDRCFNRMPYSAILGATKVAVTYWVYRKIPSLRYYLLSNPWKLLKLPGS